MSYIIPTILMSSIIAASSWLISNIFSFVWCWFYKIIEKLNNYLILKIAQVSDRNKRESLGHLLLFVNNLYFVFTMSLWPAYIVTWIVLPNSTQGGWIIYAMALLGYWMGSGFRNLITLWAFIAFCIWPNLIYFLYGWLPFINYILYPSFSIN